MKCIEPFPQVQYLEGISKDDVEKYVLQHVPSPSICACTCTFHIDINVNVEWFKNIVFFNRILNQSDHPKQSIFKRASKGKS